MKHNHLIFIEVVEKGKWKSKDLVKYLCPFCGDEVVKVRRNGDRAKSCGCLRLGKTTLGDHYVHTGTIMKAQGKALGM